MKPETMKKIGLILAITGAISGAFGVQTDDARTKARSLKNVPNPNPREAFKEYYKSEETTTAMTWGGALMILAGIGLVESAKNKSK